MVDTPEHWGTRTNLAMSTRWLTSWVRPLQPKVPHGLPLCVGSILLGPSILVHSLEWLAFSFFSSISVFSFLFSCCRWTMTVWSWLGKESEEQAGVQSASQKQSRPTPT